MSLAPGYQLGPYEILARVGAGGMGEVWKARDTRLNRIVAIKQTNGVQGARFQQEARAIAALNHPNICQIHDIGPDYLVLEFIDGKPLAGPLPTDQALTLACQIASALEAAHKHGILHRDLKPANVMVNESGAKLLDFGLARLETELDLDATRTSEGAIMGTPAYMSPEQARGKPADVRSDIFSFGALLYELLAGRRAFEGETLVDILTAVSHAEPAALPPSPLAQITRRCLRKSPADRYQSIAELLSALQPSEPTAEPRRDGRASIAVLPFANMSGDKDQEYFSDGLAEEIINALAQIPNLKVIARTSAFAFRGKEQDIRTIAEALDVKTILEGSVRRAGNRIRVMAQLISAADGSHMWSERYDRELADVFEVQDEIAASIAKTLRVKLVPGAAKKHTPNGAAYESYLKARQFRGRLTPDAIIKYRELLEQTICLDPGFALARVDIADSYLMQATGSHDYMPLAREWAQRALELEPDLPQAQAMMGIAACIHDYDWKEGERLFARAMAQEPVPPQIRQWHSFFCLLPSGRAEESIDEMLLGLRDDPLNLLSRQCMPMSLVAADRPEAAIHDALECCKLDSQLPFAQVVLSLAYIDRGRYEEAAASAWAAYSLTRWPNALGIVAGLRARDGDLAGAEDLLQEMGDQNRYSAPLGMLWYSLLAGDVDGAAAWCRKAIPQGHPMLVNQVLAAPITKPLRASPHWPALAKSMNLRAVGLWA